MVEVQLKKKVIDRDKHHEIEKRKVECPNLGLGALMQIYDVLINRAHIRSLHSTILA